MKLRKTLVMVLAACMIVGLLAGTAFAYDGNGPEVLPEVASDPGHPEYYNFDGSPALWSQREAWEGWKVTGEGNWAYYVHGVKQYHWQYIDGNWYYFLPGTGWMVQYGTMWIEGRLCIFDESGKWVSTPGWYYIPDYFYVYENDNPAIVRPASGYAVFHLNQNGYVETGWNYIDGAWRYGDRWSGRMLSNEWYHNTEYDWWYYFDEDAAMVTGWYTVASPLTNRTYYFNQSGVMQWGWLYDNGNWYYLSDVNGARVENRFELIKNPVIGDWWYLFDENGVMQTGWVQVKVQEGTGQVYDLVDANGRQGVAILGSGQDVYKWYYLLPWGGMVTGEQFINGHPYYFDEVSGELLDIEDWNVNASTSYLVPLQ